MKYLSKAQDKISHYNQSVQWLNPLKFYLQLFWPPARQSHITFTSAISSASIMIPN